MLQPQQLQYQIVQGRVHPMHRTAKWGQAQTDTEAHELHSHALRVVAVGRWWENVDGDGAGDNGAQGR